jgi:hypothetical protein
VKVGWRRLRPPLCGTFRIATDHIRKNISNISLTNTMTHSNPYVANLMAKGYSERELQRPVARPEVPANMRHIYKTYDEYREALHDFLNGN